MRVSFDGQWICHCTWHGCVPKPPLKVVSLSGEVLLHITEDDLEWPGEERTVELYDVLVWLGIPVPRHCLFDLVCSEPALNLQCQLVKDSDQQVHFGKAYILIQRSCARCAACGLSCTRSGTHRLCCHGNFKHLWCRPQQHSGNDKPKRRKLNTIVVAVECYVNGLDSQTRFSVEEIQTELINIKEYYGITLPESFNVR